MSENSNQTFITQGKLKREELSLPQLHYIVADDWINKIGNNAFIGWLKLYSLADRSNTSTDVDKWRESHVPRSITSVAKELNMTRTTLYNTVIRPLWNYGLIDLKEYYNEKIKGTSATNIIVYKYPQNKKELETKPLEKIRDYETDYNSNARVFGKLGGRPKGKKDVETHKKGEKEGGIKETDITTRSQYENEIEKTNLPIAIQKTLAMNMQNVLHLFKNKHVRFEDINYIYEQFKNDLTDAEISTVLNNTLSKKINTNFYNYLSKSLLNYMNDNKQVSNKENDEPISTEVIPDWFKEQKAEQKAREQEKKNKLPTVGDYRNESGEIDIESLLDSFK